MITDQQEEDLLRNYLDHMVELYLQLRASQPADAVRDLARVLTFTTLQRLGADRKGVVVQFLHDAELLTGNQPIVTLSGANLNNANLRGANLNNANLRGANLSEANLSKADLSGTDLSGTDLDRADLSNANLSGANLSNAKLIKANLSEANLSGADLSQAGLLQANLSEADLSGARNLTQLQLDHVFSCKGATLPAGLTCHNVV